MTRTTCSGSTTTSRRRRAEEEHPLPSREHLLAEVPKRGGELLARRGCAADARPPRLGQRANRVLIALRREHQAALVLGEEDRDVELGEQLAERPVAREVRLPDPRGDLHRRKAGD